MTTCAAGTPVWRRPLGNLVNSVAISDDATRVVAGTYGHDYGYGGGSGFATYGFDSVGNQLWTQELDTTQEGVYWVALSGDGQYAAACGKIINTANPHGVGFIQAFDAANGTVLLDFQLSGDNIRSRVNKVALSANGGVLAAVAGTSLYVSTLSGGQYSAPIATFIEGSQNWVDTVAVSDDGVWIVAGSSSGHVYLFSNAGGAVTLAGTFLLPNGATCRCAVFAPGGQWFAVSGGNSDTGGACCLFNTAAFAAQPAAVWTQLARGPVYYVTLTSGGTAQPPLAAAVTNTPWQVVTAVPAASAAGQVALFKVTGAASPLIAATFATQFAPNSASFDASGKFLAVADGYPPVTGTGNFYLFAVDGLTLSCQWSFATSKMSWPIAVAALGGAVAAGSDDGSAYFFNT